MQRHETEVPPQTGWYFMDSGQDDDAERIGYWSAEEGVLLDFDPIIPIALPDMPCRGVSAWKRSDKFRCWVDAESLPGQECPGLWRGPDAWLGPIVFPAAEARS